MLDIKILEESWFFKKIFLKSKEVVFDEWDFDENIYIILTWELIIEKYTQKNSKETKILANLKKFDIFWEASLNTKKAKEVKITAKRKTVLLSINAKEWINEFSKKFPEQWLNLLKYIIYLSNKRLLEANTLITATYKISKEIIELEEINNKKIFELIDKLKEIINVSYILYFEKNPVMENFIKLKYDTRSKWSLQDEVIEITDNKLDLLSLKVDDYYNFIQKLAIWENELWFLIFFKKDSNFNENDKKVLTSATTSIAWLIKQKQILDEERDIEYLK